MAATHETSDTRMDMTDALILAMVTYHEVGHAVAAKAFGSHVVSVDVFGGGYDGGNASYRVPAQDYGSFEDMVVTLAGPVAECEFMGWCGIDDHESCMVEMLDLIDAADSGTAGEDDGELANYRDPTNDMMKARRIAQDDIGEEWECNFRGAYSHAVALVREHWAAVQDLAVQVLRDMEGGE